MQTKTYIFFGNVGAGKGTQITLLKKFLEEKTAKKVVYAYPGEYFRQMVTGEGFTNSLGKEIMQAGKLMPLFLVAFAVSSVVAKEMDSFEDHLIFDGFPRSIEQVTVFNSIVKFYKREQPEIVCIEISKEEAKKRLLGRGRSDDTEEGINKRFEEYEQNVLPALNLLKEQGVVIHSINGEQSVEGVRQEIFSKLKLTV